MDSVEAQLRSLEEQLLQPDVRRDSQHISLLLADEFREFGSSGRIFNKEQILHALQNDAPSGFVIEDFQSTPLCAGTILVTYRVTRHNLSMYERSASLRSSIWTRRDNRWQMLFHQGTKTTGSGLS